MLSAFWVLLTLFGSEVYGDCIVRPNDTVLTIGALGIEGSATLFTKFNLTFEKYLTENVGVKYGKVFKMYYLDFASALTQLDCNNALDLYYANPALFMCASISHGVRALVSQKPEYRVGNASFVTSYLAGNFYVRSNDSRIQSLADVRNKTLGGASAVSLASGIAQQRTLLDHGINMFQDAAEIVFTNDQSLVLTELLRGTIDVAMVPSGALENYAAQGLVDAHAFRLLDPNATFSPAIMPFPISGADVYPDWPLAVVNTTTITDDIATDIVKAMLDWAPASPEPSGIARWTVPLDYVPVDTMQRDVGFIQASGRCADSTDVYDVLACPANYLKYSREEFLVRCTELGYTCPSSNYTCVCSPCRAVDPVPFIVYPDFTPEVFAQSKDLIISTTHRVPVYGNVRSYTCVKLGVCSVQQHEVPSQHINYTVIDTRYLARMQLGEPPIQNVTYRFFGDILHDDFDLAVQSAPDTYQFIVNPSQIGEYILQVKVDGVEIDESPFLVHVIPTICFSGFKANANGGCVCDSRMHYVRHGNCLPIFNPGVIVSILVGGVVFIFLCWLYVHFYGIRKADAAWIIKADEVTIAIPHEILGRGTYGLVLKGKYRGTAVAIKRVLPPKVSGNGRSSVSRPQSPQSPQTPSPVHKFNSTPNVLASGLASTAGGNITSIRAKRTSQQKTTGTGLQVVTEDPLAKDPPLKVHRLARASSEFVPPSGALPFEKRARAPGMGSFIEIPLAPDYEHRSSAAGNKRRSSAVLSFIEPDSRRMSSQTDVRSSHIKATDMRIKMDDKSHRNAKRSLNNPNVALPVPGAPYAYSGELRNIVFVNHVGGMEEYVGDGQRASTAPSNSQPKSSIVGSLFATPVWMRERHKRRKQFAEFIQEMRFITRLRHPHVVTVLGATYGPGVAEPLLVMELMDRGSLYDCLHNETVELDGDVLYKLTRDIAEGMRFLYTARPPMMHLDLKSQNVLVDHSFRGKVSDFGLSSKKVKAGGMIGTPYWMAPEVLRGEIPTTAADVYSFGITLFEMLARTEPYEGEDPMEILKAVADENLDPPKRPVLPDYVPVKIRDLYNECVHKNAHRRPDFVEICDRLLSLEPKDFEHPSDHMAQVTRDRRLLEDIFPPRVAKMLREGRQVEPERFDPVTIFFSDVVNYTVISSTLDPEKVVDMLGRLYSKFDHLTKEFGLFKVETIGDAYVAVAGLPDPCEDHTARIGRFAIAAVRAASETEIDLEDPSKGNLSIRVGFHMGPIVGSVVGTANPRYCLFGDTINTSARMETTSLPSCIHMSEMAASALRIQAQSPSEFKLLDRGIIHVKGKGEMRTHFLLYPGGPDPLIVEKNLVS